MITLAELNEVSRDTFIQLLGEIFEHSPWVAERVEPFRPFSSFAELYGKMVEQVRKATMEEKLLLICAHPSLGARMEMGKQSKKEQKRAGLQDLSEEEHERFLSLNEQYMTKFMFPFIIAVKDKTKEEIYKALQKRLQRTREEELQAALAEIYRIAEFRLQEQFAEL